jgi:FkbM family methyltransferase
LWPRTGNVRTLGKEANNKYTMNFNIILRIIQINPINDIPSHKNITQCKNEYREKFQHLVTHKNRGKKAGSEDDEDFILYDNIYKNQTQRGFYLEIGAFDGIQSSNTLFFEECLFNWTGLLVEPSVKMYQHLIQNRPQNFLKNAAPSCQEKQMIQFVDHGYTGMSTDLENGPGHLLANVSCYPLQDIFDEFKITKIDFFSLDVEGREISVLETINFEKTKIDLFLIEVQRNKDIIVKFMNDKGYYGTMIHVSRSIIFAKPDFHNGAYSKQNGKITDNN